MNIAIIPARGGSKRIPRKNIKIFHGKPMLVWSIETAIKSQRFEKIVVSSDDHEILEIAQKYEVFPLLRETKLADDETPTFPVVSEAIRACINLGWEFDFACCIYPCAPFTTAEDLRSALDLLAETNSNFLYPICTYSHPIQRALRLSSNGVVSFVDKSFELSRTQDLEVNYYDAGQFYWGRKSAWLKEGGMHSGAVGMIFPSWRFVDIDSLEDWRRAEIIFPVLRNLFDKY